MRYLGVDPGGKRLGLAVADDATGLVSPLEVIPYGGVQAAAEALIAAARRHRASLIVIGLPTRADGSDTPGGRRSRAIADAVAARGLEIILQPELLSTREARRRAREAGLPGDRPVDHLAAQIILEDHLASLVRRRT
jgi:putative Holliday junction resolvase